MRSHRRTFGYARVSSHEQAVGTSLQDQQDVIRRYAEGRGLAVTRFYVEAESAVHEKLERREQIQALLREVGRGDLVLCDKLDRWSRDPEFTYRSVREMLAAGVSFYAVGDSCDPSTPEGDTTLGFRILFAREEHKRIKQRMVGTRHVLKDRGYFADGLPTFGYARQPVRGPEKNVLVIDQAKAEIVRSAFRLSIEGKSLSESMTALGIGRDTISYMLSNRMYLGEMRDASGAWIKGRHPALIDARTFVESSKAVDRRRLNRVSKNESSETASWWLRDIARCLLCGAKLSAAYGPTNKAGTRHVYFRCYARCTSRFVSVRQAEAACDPLVLERLRELREAFASSRDRREQPIASPSIEDRIAKLQRKRARYVEAFSDGAMSRDDLREAMSKLDEERTKLDAIAIVRPVASPAQRRVALRDVSAMARAWRQATPTDRRALVGGLANAVNLAADQSPRFDWVSSEILALRDRS